MVYIYVDVRRPLPRRITFKSSPSRSPIPFNIFSFITIHLSKIPKMLSRPALSILGLWAAMMPATLAWGFRGFSEENCYGSLEFKEENLSNQRCTYLSPGDTESFHVFKLAGNQELYFYEDMDGCTDGGTALDIFHSGNNGYCYDWNDEWRVYMVANAEGRRHGS
jgi:hypothetical protein